MIITDKKTLSEGEWNKSAKLVELLHNSISGPKNPKTLDSGGQHHSVGMNNTGFPESLHRMIVCDVSRGGPPSSHRGIQAMRGHSLHGGTSRDY